MKRSLFYLPISFFIVTFILLILPGNEFPTSNLFNFRGLDKIVHTVLFFTLTWLFGRPFKKATLPRTVKNNWFITITVSTIIYGIIMEFVQLFFVPFRSFELADIIVDALGALLGYFYCRKYFL